MVGCGWVVGVVRRVPRSDPQALQRAACGKRATPRRVQHVAIEIPPGKRRGTQWIPRATCCAATPAVYSVPRPRRAPRRNCKNSGSSGLVWGQQRFEQKLRLLGGVISRLDPDVVALAELGGEEPLRDLQQALGGAYPHRGVSAFPDRRGIRVAFI